MRRQPNPVIDEAISALEQSGALKDDQGTELIEKLAKCKTIPELGLVASVIGWLLEKSETAVVNQSLSLGLWLARMMQDGDRKNYEVQIFQTLFGRCIKALGPTDENVLMLARILGDRADDDLDWQGSQLWYASIVDNVPMNEIGEDEAIIRSLVSHALRGLTAIAVRNKDFDLAWDYAKQDFNLYQGIGVADKEISLCLTNLTDIARQSGRIKDVDELRAQRT